MTTKNEHNMGREFDTLDEDQKDAVRKLVEKVERTGKAESEPFGNGDIYAYPHPSGGIAWGVNGGKFGINVARDIYKPRKK